MSGTTAQSPQELADGVAALLRTCFAPIEQLAAVVASCVPAQRKLREDDLAPAAALIKEVLPGDELLVGMGFVADPGVVAGEEHFLLWWQLRGGKAARLRLNLDAASPDLYDYTQMPWFALARQERRGVVHGPYVDYAGSDLFTMTAAVPVVADGMFLGVAGVDLQFLELDRRLVRLLRPAGTDACVIDAVGRVIATNNARWVVSSRFKQLPVPGRDGVAHLVAVPGDYGWSLVIGDAG